MLELRASSQGGMAEFKAPPGKREKVCSLNSRTEWHESMKRTMHTFLGCLWDNGPGIPSHSPPCFIGPPCHSACLRACLRAAPPSPHTPPHTHLDRCSNLPRCWGNYGNINPPVSPLTPAYPFHSLKSMAQVHGGVTVMGGVAWGSERPPFNTGRAGVELTPRFNTTRFNV